MLIKVLTSCFFSLSSKINRLHYVLPKILSFILFFLRFYLFIFRQRAREGGRERNINVWLPHAHPDWGPGPQTRHMPWLGIELATLWFTGWCSIHWTTPARAKCLFVFFNLTLQVNFVWIDVFMISIRFKIHFPQKQHYKRGRERIEKGDGAAHSNVNILQKSQSQQLSFPQR